MIRAFYEAEAFGELKGYAFHWSVTVTETGKMTYTSNAVKLQAVSERACPVLFITTQEKGCPDTASCQNDR